MKWTIFYLSFISSYTRRFSRNNLASTSFSFSFIKFLLPLTLSPRIYNLVTVQSPRSTRSSSVVTISRPPTSSSLKITNRSFQHAVPRLWNKINFLTLSVSLIHILVFHLLTNLHKSDRHCHLHLCHHQWLFLFFTLDLKHTSSSSLFHRRLHHRYTYHIGQISRTPGRTVSLLLIGFVLVFSSRLSVLD